MLLGLSLLLLGWREGSCLQLRGQRLCPLPLRWVTAAVRAPAVAVPPRGSCCRGLSCVAVPDAKPPSGFI